MATEQIAGNIRPVPIRRVVDFATIGGLAGAFAFVATAVALTGAAGAYFDLRSVLIVLGGTAGTTLACFTLGDMRAAGRITLRTINRRQSSAQASGLQMLDIAFYTRINGLLSVQSALENIDQDSLLFIGIQMAVDGVEDTEIQNVLSSRAANISANRDRSIEVLKRASELAPGMGLIGTLIGLVQMLTRLDDPSSIGPAMAVALLTTFYGVILSNMVFIPLAYKLKRAGTDEDLINKMAILTSVSVQRQENPRRLEALVNAIIPPNQRIRYFE